MSTETKGKARTKPSYWVHLIIGLLLMIGFPQLGPFEPITETGMWVAGILIGMVYLWSTLDSIWPSILGLLLFALYSGFLGEDVTGYNAVRTVFLNAFGSDIVMTVILGMVLFGAIECAGCTTYLARFFLTRKIITGVFTSASGVEMSYLAYIAYNFIMAILLMLLFLIFVKLVLRPDVSKLKDVSPEFFNKNQLPPMSLPQKVTLLSALAFIVLLLAPSFMPKDWAVTTFLNSYGTTGIMGICIIALMVLHYEGKPLLDYRAVAKSSVSWDIFFLVAASVYVCNAVAQEQTGLKEFIVQALTPVLGNKPDLVFVGILLIVTLIMANFANNAGMATVMIPIALAFQDMYPNVPMIAVCMSMGMIVFVGAVAPAASPYCAMLHAQRDKISFKHIEICALPMSLIAWICYTVIGYPLASILFTAL